MVDIQGIKTLQLILKPISRKEARSIRKKSFHVNRQVIYITLHVIGAVALFYCVKS